LLWTLGAIVAYTVVGFLVLPPIVKVVAVRSLSSLLNRKVTIQGVAINPYVLSGAIRGLVIRDKDGEPLASWDEAYANLQLVSFLGKQWVFKEIRVTQPFARVQINKDGSLNIEDLVKKFGAVPPEPAKKKKPLFLHIMRLDVTGASASLTDLTPSTPFRRRLGPLKVTLTELHTDPKSKDPFSLSGTTDSGEKFSWSGYFRLNPLLSEGQLSLTGLSLSKYAPLYQDLVRFEIKEGALDCAAGYRLGLDSSNYIAEVNHAMLSMKSLKVSEKNSDRNLAELDKLVVNEVNANLEKRNAEIASLVAEGARLDLRRGKDEKINLTEMARPAETATNAPRSDMLLLQAITNVFGFLSLSTNVVSATLHQIEVTNCLVSWEDLATAHPVNLRLDNIALEGKELSNFPRSNMTAAISLRWNTNGTIRSETTAQLSPPAADVSLALTDVELAALGPYLESFVNLFLIGGKVGLDSQMRLWMTNEVLNAKLAADLRLDDFATIDGFLREDLVKWKSLHISGLEANLVPSEATIKQIELQEPLARVVVTSHHVINVVAALKKKENANVPAQSVETTPPPTPSSTPTPVDGKSKQEPSSLAAGTNAASSNVLPQITVNRVVITNATAEFSDQSSQPPVTVSIRALNGTISDLSSKESARADLNLEGKVDGTGPVKIVGKLEPLRPKAATDLTVSLHEVDLKPTSPYVGRYAGYRLVRGKFNLDLDGSVSGNTLSATNHFVLDQFTLGEKVESPDATHLPVRLGVALLKDRSGKIALDLPLAGSLDDPKFNMSSVVSQALGDVITKVTTSPFAALGAVFGGNGEELSYQEFAPGSAELQSSARKKLEALVKGLYERPGLAVEIEGSVDPKADGERLAQQPDKAQLSPAEREAKAFAVPAAEANSDSRQRNSPASSTTQPAELARGARNSQTPPASRPHDEKLPKPALVPEGTDDALKQLARRRAERVKEYLLQVGKVDGERVFLAEDSETKISTKGCRAYIHLR
jgi:hypothetical protein